MFINSSDCQSENGSTFKPFVSFCFPKLQLHKMHPETVFKENRLNQVVNTPDL